MSLFQKTPKMTGCLVLAVFLFLQGCAIVVIPGLQPRKSRLRELELHNAEGWFVTNKVLLVDISGVLTSHASRGLLGSSRNMADKIKEILDKAAMDPNIKALVLRIDSPGGDVTTSNIIYRELKNFREHTGKKVIVEMMGLAASGAYYIAMAADEIYAHPTTLTGNIGVVSVFPNLEGLTSKIGVDVRVIKSGDKKDMGSMWRDFSSEERKIIQSVIDEYYEQFLNVIQEGRPGLDRETLLKLADGRVFTASQALEAGLIDGIAYLPESIEKAREAAGISDSSLVTYKRSYEYKNTIYALSEDPVPQMTKRTQIGIFNLDANGLSLYSGPHFLYLWLP